MKIIEKSGKRFAVVPLAEFERMKAAAERGRELPAMPTPDEKGEVPAIAFVRAVLARRIVAGREAAGLSQAELARRAGLRVETINRLEKGKQTADEGTMRKIQGVFEEAKGAGVAGAMRGGTAGPVGKSKGKAAKFVGVRMGNKERGKSLIDGVGKRDGSGRQSRP